MRMHWDFSSIFYSVVGSFIGMTMLCYLAHGLGSACGLFLANPSWDDFLGFVRHPWIIVLSPALVLPSLATWWGFPFYPVMIVLYMWTLYDDESMRRWLTVGAIFILAGADAFRMGHLHGLFAVG